MSFLRRQLPRICQFFYEVHSTYAVTGHAYSSELSRIHISKCVRYQDFVTGSLKNKGFSVPRHVPGRRPVLPRHIICDVIRAVMDPSSVGNGPEWTTISGQQRSSDRVCASHSLVTIEE
ncbi:hypothetical protein SUGI_0735940 [Cryptomeria japonica]|nr:hypothetical protein SUGI_0735940 [Cryptomeria japonica]